MIAFWESPFEYFLLVDSDSCVWGDMREHIVDYDKYDVIIDKPCYSYTLEQINAYYFNIEQMQIHFPKFKCLDYPYANAGVIFGKRGIFDIEEYENILNFIDMHPGVFFIGDQGFLTYMLFNAADEQKIRLGSRDLQYIVCNFEIEETKKKFKIQNGKPLIDNNYRLNCREGLTPELLKHKRSVTESISNSVVMHWCGGTKPIYSNRKFTYIEPMTYFRKKFLKDSTNKSPYEIDQIILKEDKLKDNKGKKWRRLLKKLSSLLIGRELTSKLSDFFMKN